MPRGAFLFQTSDAGDLINSARNVELLRELWLHRTLIDVDNIGPGDRGDFSYGAWHVACHLAGAGGVRATADGTRQWLEISHDPARDDYYASVTFKSGGKVTTLRLDSAEGRLAVRGTSLLGFIEGTSKGRTSARHCNDSPELFNLWRRQDFDQPLDSDADGGKVWEHWCTLRDIRSSHRIATSVLTAFVSLSAALGDRFIATVARGRRDYGHPAQLAASVFAGLVSPESALADLTPTAIPKTAIDHLLESRPDRALQAAELLDWSRAPRYYMFERKIADWSPASTVRDDLAQFTPT